MTYKEERKSGTALSASRIVALVGVILLLSVVTGWAVVAQDSSAPFTEAAAPDALIVTPTRIQQIETGLFVPPSPDPAGITYIPATATSLISNTLLMVDCDVDEIPALWQNVNMWQLSLTGVVTKTFNLATWSLEPTGITFNPANQHLFISDDNKKKVTELTAGLILVRSFKTDLFGATDPEDVAFDPSDGPNGGLWIADGLNAEVYHVLPGPNGKFEGTGDDVITHFDTAIFGLIDSSGIALDIEPGQPYLYLVGSPNSVFHVTKTGALVRIADVDAAHAHALEPNGLVMAPGSVQPTHNHLYITDRRLDVSFDPDENDGRIYELSMPTLPSYVVSVLPEKATAMGDPGTQVVYNLRVTNVGRSTTPDTYNVSASGFEWTPTFPATVGPLGQAASANVQVAVTVPPNAGCNDKSVGTISFTSQHAPSMSATAVLTTTVTQNPPMAIDDRYEFTGPSLVVPAPGVLTNDTGCGLLTSTLLTPPAHGIVQLNPNGSFTYTPALGYTGFDSFTYAAHAGALQSTATVRVGPPAFYLYLPLVTKNSGQ